MRAISEEKIVELQALYHTIPNLAALIPLIAIWETQGLVTMDLGFFRLGGEAEPRRWWQWRAPKPKRPTDTLFHWASRATFMAPKDKKWLDERAALCRNQLLVQLKPGMNPVGALEFQPAEPESSVTHLRMAAE